MLFSPIVRCVCKPSMGRYSIVGAAVTASVALQPSTALALDTPGKGDSVECLVPGSDTPRTGQVSDVSPEGLIVDFGDGTSATLPTWLCSTRSTGPAAGPPPGATPAVSSPPATTPAAPTTDSLPQPPSQPQQPSTESRQPKSWTIGGRLGYAFYIRSLNAYAASPEFTRVFTEQVAKNKFFAFDRQLLASAYAEAWSQRVDFDAGTSTLVGGGEADYEKLGFKYTSRFLRMGDEVWLLGLYAYDRASLTKEVDRIIEVSTASYSLRKQALGLAIDWDSIRAASESADDGVVSGSFSHFFVGVSAVKFRNEVERSREDLRTGQTDTSVRWFESDGIWPVLTTGFDQSIVGTAGRFSCGLLGFLGLNVPMTSWQGDSHGWGNMVYEYTGYLDTEILVHDHVSLGADVRFVMYDNRFEVEGQDEAFYFKEMRAVGQALLAARY